MAEREFPLTRTMVKAFALAITKRSGCAFNEELGPSDHWWQLLKRHHPVITLHRADNLEWSQAEHLLEDVNKECFF